MTTVCRVCLQLEDEHHEFIPFERPDHCRCDPGEWAPNDMGPVCDAFTGEESMRCVRCEHDKPCHLEA